MIRMGSRFVGADGALTREGYETLRKLEADISAIVARLDAAAAVSAPTGGATVDTQSRTAIAAILGALA